MLLNGLVMNTRRHNLTYSFCFFIYYLKKEKCSITSHTEMYCLRKKIYSYIFSFFLIFFKPFFLFRKYVSIKFHQKNKTKNKTKKKVFWTQAASCCRVPAKPSPPAFLKKMHKEIHNSQLPFWFHKLIQSHMCYTGLELEHCKLFSWILLFSIVGYKKEQAT